MDKKVWLALAILSLGGCRIVSQQELADLKSPPNPHMANIDQTWQKNIVPQVVENARPVAGNDSNLLIVFYVQIMPDDLVMQLHR
ncbi:DUF2291 family protein, partial [Escherichia coli]